MNLLIFSSHSMEYIWNAPQKSNYRLNITVVSISYHKIYLSKHSMNWSGSAYVHLEKIHEQINPRNTVCRTCKAQLIWCDQGLVGSAMLLGKFKCQGVLIIRIIVGPTVLAIGAGVNCLDIFSSLSYLFSCSLCLGDCSIQTEIFLREPLTEVRMCGSELLFLY